MERRKQVSLIWIVYEIPQITATGYALKNRTPAIHWHNQLQEQSARNTTEVKRIKLKNMSTFQHYSSH